MKTRSKTLIAGIALFALAAVGSLALPALAGEDSTPDDGTVYPYERRQEAWQSLSPEEQEAYKQQAAKAARQHHDTATARRQEALGRWQGLSPEEQEAYKQQAEEAARQHHDTATARRQEALGRWQGLSPEEQEAVKGQVRSRAEKRQGFRQGRRSSRGK
tara:strand:+ start:295 stop:774 length:480 start_codon:yes stop_codon:yes gene_type:complete